MSYPHLCIANKKFRNALQVLSLAVISCTLVVYQVNSAVQATNELYSGNGLILEEVSGSSNVIDGDPLPDNHASSSPLNKSRNSSLSKRYAAEEAKIPMDSQPEALKLVKVPGVVFQNRPKLIVDNLFLSVKSTKRFHDRRLRPVLKTWFNFARDQTWIFTDADDPELESQTNGHIINTRCPATHHRQALCCKMSMEFDAFLRTSKSWFCHFDDDNYVNVPALLELLGRYNHWEDWYLGKPSLKSSIRIPNPNNRTEEVSFWFATGGAGFCISRALALRMSPLARGGKFIKVCDRIQLPDDVTVGYIVGHLLGKNLTVIPQFHSHFETMKFIDMKSAHSEITFSYARHENNVNLLDVSGFTEEEDPTRFLSLHCQLYPNFSFCPNAL